MDDGVESCQVGAGHVAEVVGHARHDQLIVVEHRVSIEAAIEAENLMPLRQKPRHQQAADVAITSGDQDPHRLRNLAR
jgi:hypothetical protein